VPAASRRRPSRLVLALAVAAVALPLVARAVATQWDSDVLWANAARAAGGSAEPYDLRIFLAAGDDVVARRSPYVEPEFVDETQGSPYVYPPVLAFAVAPLAALPDRVSNVFVPGVLFSLLLVGSIVGALLLLDVRDWRCYPVALLYPVNLEAVEYGALGPLLLLAVALLWRYRDRAWIAAAAAGGAVVLKLFLWPLLVWLAVTDRVRAAVLGAGLAVGLALLAWAAIGFAAIGDYPRLLRELVELEGTESYSAYAVLAKTGLPDGVARTLVAVCALALLALAWRAARAAGEPRFERDRRSLTLVLAAALVATPILWLHYLGLLLVPIALARPRLSALWLAPLSLTVFEALDWYRGWPRGDTEALASVALVVALVFAVALAPRRPSAAARGVAATTSAAAPSR
jgi:alpha-1,2-mannosyltransferase